MSSTPLKRNPHHDFPDSENSDPNMPILTNTPSKKPTKTLSIKPASAKKPAAVKKRPVSPPMPPRERPFIIVAKKNMRRDVVDVERRKKAAYDALRASHEDFFRKDHELNAADGSKADQPADAYPIGELCGLQGSSKVRKLRSMVMEEAMSSIPEQGSGRVKHLVRAFESLLSISRDLEADGVVGDTKKQVMNWALPGLGQPRIAVGAEVSSCSVSSAGESFACNDFERDSRVGFSINSNVDRLSLGSRTSSGGRRSRQNSTDLCGRSWNKMLKVTNQQPFKLRTEQRGRQKEENFLKKVKEMIMEDEKKRIPIAQGLPWTTEEPEVLVKPPVKERTEPIDLVLHSDVRAVERAEFDHYIAERMSLAEHMRLERERQQKLQEKEEIRRLRRDILVPRAQPMPYFDRPFVPKKSTRPRTIPKEPRFHIRPMKSSCISMLER